MYTAFTSLNIQNMEKKMSIFEWMLNLRENLLFTSKMCCNIYKHHFFYNGISEYYPIY